MSAIATAVVGSALISGAGSFMGSRAASKSAQSAADANLQAARETNELNKQMFDESRGSTGSAVLPTYLKDYEESLGRRLAEGTGSIIDLIDVNGRLQAANQALGDPSVAAGDQLIRDLYSGQALQERQAALAPVAEARRTQALTRAQSINAALDQVLKQQTAQAAQRGFVGGSTFDRNRLFASTAQARAQAADALAAADLQNAIDTRGLSDQDLQLRLQYLNEPFSRYQNKQQTQDYGLSSALNLYSQAMQPLSFFRLGQDAFQYQNMPTQQAIPSSSQYGWGAVSGLGNNLSQFFTNQSLINQLNNAGLYGTLMSPSNLSTVGYGSTYLPLTSGGMLA